MPPLVRLMETAPKDGTLIFLYVSYYGEDGHSPLSDEAECWTIGFNNFDHDHEDVWKFAGWNWQQDCFTEGGGHPLMWAPLPFEGESMSIKNADWLAHLAPNSFHAIAAKDAEKD